MSHEQLHTPTESTISYEVLPRSDEAIETALSMTFEDYVREDGITPESRSQLINVARDNFYAALEQGRPYGVALAFALESCRGFNKENISEDEATMFFWDAALESPLEGEATGEEIEQASRMYGSHMEQGPYQPDVVSGLGAVAASAVNIEMGAETPSHTQIDVIEEPTQEEIIEVKVTSENDKLSNPERKERAPDALRIPSWRQELPEMDMENLEYTGKLRGKDVDAQPVITVGYDAKKIEQFDGGISDGEEADLRGAAIFRAADGSEYYLDRGFMTVRSKNDKGHFADDGTIQRIKALRASINRPLEYTYEDADGNEVQQTIDSVIVRASRMIPTHESRKLRMLDEQHNNKPNWTVRRWQVLAKRMDDLIDRLAKQSTAA